MIHWTIYKRRLGVQLPEEPHMSRVRAERRLDVVVAKGFLDSWNFDDISVDIEKQRMHVPHHGFVDKDEYFHHLEYDV